MHCIFYPARADVVEKDPRGWTANPETALCNGPFMLSEWKHNSEMILVKNPNYWDTDNVSAPAVRSCSIGRRHGRTIGNTRLKVKSVINARFSKSVPVRRTVAKY